MTINPIRRASRRLWALLEPGWRTLRVLAPEGEWRAQGSRQCYELLDSLAPRRIFYVRRSLTSMIHTTGAECWSAEVWRGRPTRLLLDGSKAQVISLRGALGEDPSEGYDALSEVLGWLSDYGIGPGALASMGWNLWRATLSRAVTIESDEGLGHSAVFGGRQEIREVRTYSRMVAADISSAYPFEMGTRPFALTLRPVSASTELDPTEPGIARAVVSVPSDLPFAPLPVRVARDMVQWQYGTFEGVWTWGELAAARGIGASVSVAECWAPGRSADLFSSWWHAIEVGRGLSAPGAKLAKAIAASLWGCFGMRGDDTAMIRWVDSIGDRSVTVKKSPRVLPHHWTAHVAAEASSRVRVRLLTEGLYGGPFSPVHVDTDGMIIRSTSELPSPHGDGPGQWRAKEKMRKVDIRAPQLFRYRCEPGSCRLAHRLEDPWHYKTAGVPSEHARAVFERVGRLGIHIGTGTRDIVLPPANSLEVERISAMVRLATAAAVTIYGPPLGGGPNEE